MKKIINWRELSRHLGKKPGTLRPENITKYHFDMLDKIFLIELPEWWRKEKKRIKKEQ